MKKVITIMLILAITLTLAASAETLTTLKQVQDYILDIRPRFEMSKDTYVTLTGTVAEIISAYDKWYVYRIICDEDKAQEAYMFGYDAPCFYTWGFDLAVGDRVRVDGKLNILYSSVLMPFIGQAQITPVQE